jgi:hypothetical protein
VSDTLTILVTIASPIFAAGGAYAATRVHLQWLRRDVDDAHERIDAILRTLMRQRSLSTGMFEALLTDAPATKRRG